MVINTNNTNTHNNPKGDTMTTAIQTDLTRCPFNSVIVAAQKANAQEAADYGVPAAVLDILVYNQFIDGRTLPALIREAQGFGQQLPLV